MHTKVEVLIVSPPGDLQIGLQALLTVHLDVDVIVVGEGSSALKVIERHKPALVILDQDIPGNSVAKLVQDIKTSWPEIVCLVLVNHDEGLRSVMDVGVDFVTVKGLPGPKLVAEIKKLLNLEK